MFARIQHKMTHKMRKIFLQIPQNCTFKTVKNLKFSECKIHVWCQSYLPLWNILNKNTTPGVGNSRFRLVIIHNFTQLVSRRDPGLRLIFVLSFILVFSQAVLLSHVRLFSSSYTYWLMDPTLFHPRLFITYWLIWISQLRMNTHRLFWRHAWHLRFICIFTLQYDTLFWQRLPHYYSASQWKNTHFVWTVCIVSRALLFAATYLQ